MTKPVPTSPDDSRLLETANRLKGQLQIESADFSRIQWVEMVPSGRRAQPVPSDQVFYTRTNTVLMPGQLRGNLTVEEWKPLMASSMIYERKIVPTLRWKLLPLRILPSATFLILLFALTFLFGGFIGALIIYLIIALAVNSLTARRRVSILKKARLEADNQTRTIIGKQSLLSALKKIDSMDFKDVEARKTRARAGPYRGLPTITERIENLRGYPSNSSN